LYLTKIKLRMRSVYTKPKVDDRKKTLVIYSTVFIDLLIYIVQIIYFKRLSFIVAITKFSK